MMRLCLLMALVVVPFTVVPSRDAHAQKRSHPAATAKAKTNLSEAARGAEEAAANALPEAKPAPGAVPANMPLRAGGPIPTPQLVELEDVSRRTLEAVGPQRVNLAAAAAQAPDEEPEPKVIRPHEPLPQNLPLPAGSATQPQGPAAQVLAAPAGALAGRRCELPRPVRQRLDHPARHRRLGRRGAPARRPQTASCACSIARAPRSPAAGSRSTNSGPL